MKGRGGILSPVKYKIVVVRVRKTSPDNIDQNNTKMADVIRVAFIFLSVVLVGFVFKVTDAEYKYNQQIARGFISQNAIFFDIDDLSYKEAFYMSMVMSLDEVSDEPIVIDTSPKEARDASFVLENKTMDNGLTAVESLLSSSNGDYMASLHKGVLRGVFYKGRTNLPPLVSGRFISEEECLSDKSLAVIGRNYEEQITEHDGKRFIVFNGREYEVIGMVGLSAVSPIDDIIFVNLGSLSNEEQLDGMFYIDNGSNNESIYNDMLNRSENLFGCGLKLRETPKAFVDVISGGMYMKSYLKLLMIFLGVFAFLNVLIQSLRGKLVEIAVMKIQGIRQKTIFLRTNSKYLIASITGLLCGMLCDIWLILSGNFALPVEWMIRYCIVLLVAGILMILIWMVTVYVFECILNPKEVIRKI
ncbi:MAG: ABC transporter permease [Clostridiales bacterium]|nr:ABC transporter permease [Clostridiales bacterium]